MPQMRLDFPFLLKTSWDGRAKRTVRSRRETDPLLVNSYRAHKNMSITGLVYINDCKLVVRSVSLHAAALFKSFREILFAFSVQVPTIPFAFGHCQDGTLER